MLHVASTSKAVGFPMPVDSWLYNYAKTRIHDAIIQIVAARKAPGYVEDLNDYEGDSEDEDAWEDCDEDQEDDGDDEEDGDDNEDEDGADDEDNEDEEDNQEYRLTQTDIVELETWNQTDMTNPPRCMLSKPVMYKKYKQVLKIIDFECKIHKTCGGCDDCDAFM